ncbi:MAG: hypothetical protein ACI923_002708, partial [Flavobacteriales bacterium]
MDRAGLEIQMVNRVRTRTQGQLIQGQQQGRL